MKPYINLSKDLGISAVIGSNKSAPVVNASLYASPYGHEFSIGIPPSSRSALFKYGTYGAIYYNGGLMCDGYLVKSAPMANEGHYSTQLVFKDIPSYLNNLYVAFKLPFPTNVEANTKNTDDILARLWEAMRANKIDWVTREDLGSIMSVAGEIENVKLVEIEKTQGESGGSSAPEFAVMDGLAAAGNKVASVWSESAKSSGSNMNAYPIHILKGILGAVGANIGAGKSSVQLRNIFGMSNRFNTSGVADLAMSDLFGSMFMNLVGQYLSEIWGKTGISDSLESILSWWCGNVGYQKIVIPGRISNQVYYVPDFPFLGMPNCNNIGNNYESTELTMGGDLPTTLAVTCVGQNMILDPFGVGVSSSGADGTPTQSIYAERLTHVGALNEFQMAGEQYAFGIKKMNDLLSAASEIPFLGGKLKNFTANTESFSKKYYMDGIANRQLHLESLKNSRMSVTMSRPMLDLIPGFNCKVKSGGLTWCGRIAGLNYVFTQEGYSGGIDIDYAHMEMDGSALWEPAHRGRFNYASYYDVGQMYSKMDEIISTLNDANNRRAGSTQKISFPSDKSIDAYFSGVREHFLSNLRGK